MNALCERLQNGDEAGVYRLDIAAVCSLPLGGRVRERAGGDEKATLSPTPLPEGEGIDILRAAVAQAGFALFEANLSTVQGKGEFLAAIAQAVKAPDWFGTNWDALADALGDFSWLNVSGSNVSGQPAAGYVLLLHDGNDTFGLSAADHKIAMEIFSGTVDFWKSQGKPFWVFFC